MRDMIISFSSFFLFNESIYGLASFCSFLVFGLVLVLVLVFCFLFFVFWRF